MGLAVKTFLEHPILTGEDLVGESFFPTDKLNLYPNVHTDYSDVLSFWRSMGEELRPAVYYYLRFRIESDRRASDIQRVTGKDLNIGRQA